MLQFPIIDQLPFETIQSSADDPLDGRELKLVNNVNSSIENNEACVNEQASCSKVDSRYNNIVNIKDVQNNVIKKSDNENESSKKLSNSVKNYELQNQHVKDEDYLEKLSTKSDHLELLTPGMSTEHVSPKRELYRTKGLTKTSADPSFLKEFYNNSRLHLISTLGAEYKQLVNQLREKSNGTFLGMEKIIPKGIHVQTLT